MINVNVAYENGYADGYNELLRTIKEERRRKLYFLKQKLIGVAIILFSICTVPILDGDGTMCLITIPLGILLIFTKRMAWMDKYYQEMGGKDEF